MPIRPIDVRRKEFKSSFRGYDANQVDDFLDAVADEFERNYTENQRMREEVSSLRDRLQQFEDLEGSIQAALVHAEQASNDLRRAAAQEAEGIKQSAQREADFTIREAQSRSHQMLADSSARIERVQDSYDALQEAKRSFANEFRHLLKTYTDIMENMEVASAREIEASLRGRLDTESIAVVREAAQEEARSAEEAMVTAEAMAAAGMVPEPVSEDAQDTLSGLEAVDPADQELEPAMDEQPTEVIRPEGSEPETEDPEVAEPEVEPSTAQDEMDQPVQEPPVSVPEAASEVEREEPSLAEESSSQQFFDRQEGERSDSRIYRASHFLRRRE
ncbi:MAG TPA: DivIVA domain-containing protein [Rubrobacter sp.]|nr:DivIVA domain-containing protein [Rubrobacter sp.]